MNLSVCVCVFMDHAFGVILIKYFHNHLRLQRISPMFSFRSFAILIFTINTVIYFEFTVVCAARYESELLLLQMVT